MLVKHEAAIRNRKEEGFAKVKAGVPAHPQPQVPASPQGKGEDQTRDRHVRGAKDSLTGVSQVSGTKRERQAQGSGPESDPSCQSVLRVSAKLKFLRQPHQNEPDRPKRRPIEHSCPMNNECSEGISARGRDQSDQQAHLAETQNHPQPEKPTEGLPERQAINPDPPSLESRHQNGRRVGGEKAQQFVQNHGLGRFRVASEAPGELNHSPERILEEQPESEIQQEAPASPQAAPAEEDSA